MDPRDWLFDRRIVRRNLETGVLPVEQYEEHLRQLKDVKDQLEPVEVMLYPSPEQEDAKQQGAELDEDDSAGAVNE